MARHPSVNRITLSKGPEEDEKNREQIHKNEPQAFQPQQLFHQKIKQIQDCMQFLNQYFQLMIILKGQL